MRLRIRRWLGIPPECAYCQDERMVLWFGTGRVATLWACPQCRDGGYLSATMIPTSSYLNMSDAPDYRG